MSIINRYNLYYRSFLLILIIPFLFFSSYVKAENIKERITNFYSDLTVDQSGLFTVTENIYVYSTLDDIQRGIYRDIPLKTKNRNGKLQWVSLNIKEVKLDKKPIEYHKEIIGNILRIYIGSPSRIISYGKHVFTLKYTTSGQMNFFSDHDEIYWNAIGTSWNFPIDQATSIINLPKNSEIIDTNFYTGRYGSKGKDAYIDIDNKSIITKTTKPLLKNEGMSVKISIKKGSISEISLLEHLIIFINYHTILISSSIGMFIIFIFYFSAWWKIKYKSYSGHITPTSTPPTDISPAAAHYIYNKGVVFPYTEAAITIIDLAIKGFIFIEKNISGKLTLYRMDYSNDTRFNHAQEILLDALKKSNDTLVFDSKNKSIPTLISNIHSAIEKECEDNFFNKNGGFLFLGIILSFLVFIFFCIIHFTIIMFILIFSFLFPIFLLYIYDGINSNFEIKNELKSASQNRYIFSCFYVAFIFLFIIPMLLILIASYYGTMDGTGTTSLYISIIGITSINTFFYHHMNRYTLKGLIKISELEGFKEYLLKSKKDKKSIIPPNKKTTSYYTQILPFAMAVGLEKKWSYLFKNRIKTKFELENKNLYMPYWYSINHPLYDITFDDICEDIGSSITSSIVSSIPSYSSSSSSSSNSSSSGTSSGGGFSGGGGGGGGGGGW